MGGLDPRLREDDLKRDSLDASAAGRRWHPPRTRCHASLRNIQNCWFAPYTGRDMALIGMAHLALDRDQHHAELGLSVEPSQRGNGHGLTLLNRGKLSAVTRGYATLFMHCLAENKITIHLARKAGLKLVTEQGEVDAHLQLEATSHAAVAQEALEDQIALADLLFKQQFQWLFQRPHAA